MVNNYLLDMKIKEKTTIKKIDAQSKLQYEVTICFIKLPTVTFWSYAVSAPPLSSSY